jgi:hypothetical protein
MVPDSPTTRRLLLGRLDLIAEYWQRRSARTETLSTTVVASRHQPDESCMSAQARARGPGAKSRGKLAPTIGIAMLTIANSPFLRPLNRLLRGVWRATCGA